MFAFSECLRSEIVCVQLVDASPLRLCLQIPKQELFVSANRHLYLTCIAAFGMFLCPGVGKTQDSNVTPELADSEIANAIAADLEDSRRTSDSDVAVEVRKGIALLSGTSTSLHEKRVASQIAKRTRGIVAVQNQIIIPVLDRGDEEILGDVRNVLAASGSVTKPKIDVSVRRGEVSLRGKANSLAEKRNAESIVSGIRGVRSVDNQITVRLSSDRPDEELQKEISELIAQSVYFDDADITVDVKEHVAELAGAVSSAESRDRLEQVAEIWGVSAIDVSDVEVNADLMDSARRKSRYADASNLSISTALDRSFRFDPTIFSLADKIKVHVDSGVVTLTGTLSRLRYKNRAAQLAHDVVGVRRVVNKLNVEYDGDTPTDGEIIELTQAAIARSAQLDRRAIRVHCQQAHVRLYGIVDSELEKAVATWIADGIPGVVHVNNSLAVEPDEVQKSDGAIESDLRRKLKFAFFDKSNDINFTVEEGVAILRGEVDTWRQWQAAMDLAIEAGARHPHNLINVRYHPPHDGSRFYVPR